MKNIFLVLSIIFGYQFTYGQIESFENLNQLSESSNFTISNPVASGNSSNGLLRWYHNSESTITDNFFFQMEGFQAYNGSGFAYLNSGYEGYQSDFSNVVLQIIGENIDQLENPYFSFYSIHPDGDEIVNIYVNNTLVHTINSNSDTWVKSTIDLSAFSNQNSAILIEFRGSGSYESGDVGIGIDKISLYSESEMVLSSVTSEAINCNLNPGSDNQVVIKTTITTDGSLTPLNLEKLKFTSNSGNYCDNVNKVNLYKSENFTTDNLIASVTPSTEINFVTSTPLSNGNNNYYLTIDLKEDATIGDTLDFALSSVTSSGSTTTLTSESHTSTINTNGYFLVENLNASGAGSFKAALTSANSYNSNGACDGSTTATIDLRNLSGIITPDGGVNHSNDYTSLIVLGPLDQSLLIDGSNLGNTTALIYSFSDASVEVTGLEFTNFSNKVVYKPNSKGSLIIGNATFYNNSVQLFYVPNNNNNSGEIVFSIENCTFLNNTSVNELFYIPNFNGIVSIKNSTFFNNSTKDGLMYIPNGGELLIESSTFLNNSSSDVNDAGAIEAANVTMTIKNSIFDNNSLFDIGQNGGSAIIKNTFISNNSELLSSGTYQAIYSGNSGLESSITEENNVHIIKLENNSNLINAGTSDALIRDQRGLYRSDVADIGAYEFEGVNDTSYPNVPDVIDAITIYDTLGDYIHEFPVPSNITDNYTDVIITNNICFPIDISSTNTHNVIWTFTDENGNSVSRTQVIYTSSTLLTKNNLNTSLFKIFKGKGNDFITIEGLTNSKIIFKLFNILGKEVRSKVLLNNTATETFSTNGLSSGIYIVKVKSDEQLITKKIQIN